VIGLPPNCGYGANYPVKLGLANSVKQKTESTTTRIRANPKRWQRLKNILADALEETSVEERTAVLRRSCADDKTLLREAEKLLAHDTTAFEEFAEFAARRLTPNERDRIGERIGAYAIVRELGRGGMGAVYLAERADGQFEKRVAIKVLKRGTDTDEVLRRFRIERQILANLEHPNITRLLDAGSTNDGLPYFVMEFIEGMPITRFVECENVNVRDRLELFLKVCSAVEFAHQNKIVHRDIKPGNVLVKRDGEPKLLDFGIAKLLSVDASDGDTTIAAQRRLTPMYAAPEQRAGRPATIATDVYSLGALLYELLTAFPPCSSSNGDLSQRGSKAQVSSQSVTDQKTKRKVQGRLDQIVIKAMREDPALRYSSAADLAEDIERYLNETASGTECYSLAVSAGEIGRNDVKARTGSRGRWYIAAMGLGGIVLVAALLFSARTKVSGLKTVETAANATGANSPNAAAGHSIAVLPFENLSAEKENAFFADGVQEEILTHLARIADLKVIGRTSVMQYRSRGARNLRKIGQQLGVVHALEGSVQRSGNRVRVNVELVDARTDKQLWAHTYDRDLADVFAIQSEIAKVIADELQAKLSPNERSEIERPPTSNIRAFDLYTHAHNLFRTGTDSSNGKADLLEAVDLLNQAVALDPLFFQAYCRLARAHNVLYFLGHDHTPARVALAEAAIQAAFRLRPDAGEAHLARAENLYRGYLDHDGALAELEVAHQSLPNDAAVFQLMGYIQRRQGRWEESTRNLERALDLDPRDTFALQQMAWQYRDLRRYAEVKPLLDRVLAIEPNNADTKVTLASVEFHWKADTRPLHQMIESIRTTNPAAMPRVADTWLISALAERDASVAKDALIASGENAPWNNELFHFNRPFMEGVIARMMKDNDKARAAFTAARAEQEKIIQAQPNYGPPLCVLGLIDAALGRKEEALREGRRAVELLPVQKDAVIGPLMIEYSAMIAAWVGEKDLACEQLTAASRYPGPLSYGDLKLLPFWDSLRGDPRFEQIVASLAPKETLQQRR
jgi:TolB-like protein/tetratricopeptide (TPR) repeat protein